MKISELIKHLEEIKWEHGDLSICIQNDELPSKYNTHKQSAWEEEQGIVILKPSTQDKFKYWVS